MVLGIGILAHIMNKFLFLSLLVSALDTVKGKFGKAAAGIAVGASLLAASPEAQAQTPTVREVTLTTPGPSLSTSFKIGVRLIPVYEKSSVHVD